MINCTFRRDTCTCSCWNFEFSQTCRYKKERCTDAIYSCVLTEPLYAGIWLLFSSYWQKRISYRRVVLYRINCSAMLSSVWRNGGWLNRRGEFWGSIQGRTKYSSRTMRLVLGYGQAMGIGWDKILTTQPDRGIFASEKPLQDRAWHNTFDQIWNKSTHATGLTTKAGLKCDLYCFGSVLFRKTGIQWSLYYKTTHTTMKTWSYNAGGLKDSMAFKITRWDHNKWFANQGGL